MIGEISLYFHIPFCSKKCPYCHFFVLPDQANLKEKFVKALHQELALRLPLIEGKKIVSIYFGGGTPTKLPPKAFQSILEALPPLGSDVEITLETNPEDVSLPLIQEFKSLGINRISMGVQSLDDAELQTLGRQHSAIKALSAIETIQGAGISNLSIDLMFELPGQTLASWERTLARLTTLPIAHLSLYNLTFEPHTQFFKKQKALLPRLPPQEERLTMLESAISHLTAIGLERYEISAFARSGAYSRHNTGYWVGRPFLGLGPSAFSYWEGERFSNVSHLGKYAESLQNGAFPVDFRETLPPEKALRELLAIALRLTCGVNLSTFSSLPLNLQATCDQLIQRGWLYRQGETLRLTSQGQLFYDAVATELV
ncbi:MAG: radical SAM family heme chaperone HemW [Verrucomicrobia bacterium]|nr:radical SAM family heme chaperone HemW [Verrucomicrobiota bacterium]